MVRVSPLVPRTMEFLFPKHRLVPRPFPGRNICSRGAREGRGRGEGEGRGEEGSGSIGSGENLPKTALQYIVNCLT